MSLDNSEKCLDMVNHNQMCTERYWQLYCPKLLLLNDCTNVNEM